MYTYSIASIFVTKQEVSYWKA